MKSTVVRLSLSLPPEVAAGLDALVKGQGYENRSMAVTEILRQALIEDRRRNPDEVMSGSVTLFYDEGRRGVQQAVAAIQRRYLKQVVASLNVLQESPMRMEVLVVQGPVSQLEQMAQELRQVKGVEAGSLTLTSSVLPPLYEKNEGEDHESPV